MRVVAALVCAAFVGYLFWRDRSSQRDQPISWMPFVWMFIAGSRFVSAWLNLGPPGNSVDAYAEGSPVDRAVFLALIIWGALVLFRRDVDWRRLLAGNKWLVVYFLYCLLSIIWTDEPVILAKRWLKDLGNPIVALVLLTERRPFDALVLTVRRLAFVWMPVSVLFIRYFPEFGRSYAHAGGVIYSGIADGKNTLGLSCFVAGICAAWTLLLRRGSADRYDLGIVAILAWLLYTSNSKTSLACLVVAVSMMAYASRTGVSRHPARLVGVTLATVMMYVASDSLFDVKAYVLDILNRDPTLTNRTEVWDVLLSFKTNPVIGTGFMSFWTGDRMAAAWAALGGPINQAHNGYLEQYLNLGYVGVALIVAVALSALVSILRHLKTDYAAAVFRFCLIVTAMLYNYTEASFYGINNMWVLFLLASIDPMALCSTRSSTAARGAPSTGEGVRRGRQPAWNKGVVRPVNTRRNGVTTFNLRKSESPLPSELPIKRTGTIY